VTFERARISLTLIVAGCVAAPPPAPGVPPSPFEINRVEWTRSHPHSYAFTYRDQCFCDASYLWVRIVVVNDTVAQADLLPVQDARVKKSNGFQRPTVDSLFALIARAYAANAYAVDVQYDPKYHFPSHAELDWSKNIIDDEFTFDARDFTPIPPPASDR
jgi:hypothetical protein